SRYRAELARLPFQDATSPRARIAIVRHYALRIALAASATPLRVADEDTAYGTLSTRAFRRRRRRTQFHAGGGACVPNAGRPERDHPEARGGSGRSTARAR